MTLLADYTLQTRAWMPATAIVTLLTESGVTATNARTAISRLSRQGAVEGRRTGRTADYRLALPAAHALAVGGREIAAFSTDAEDWDGRWTLIAFSVPQHGDSERHALRSRLRWMGFAPLYDALWVSPQDIPAKASVALTDVKGALTIFRASQVEFDAMTGRRPLQAWDLEGIGKQYAAFLQQWGPLLLRLRAGKVGGAEAVRARTEVMDAYRQFMVTDPRLPMRMMPTGWLRDDAAAVFTSVYDGLADRALDHVLHVVAATTPEPRPGIRPHTVARLREGGFHWSDRSGCATTGHPGA